MIVKIIEMKRILFATFLVALGTTCWGQDLSLNDIVDFSASKFKEKGFTSSGGTLSKGGTSIDIRTGFRGVEVTTTDKSMFDHVKDEAADTYGKPETFHDTGVQGTVTEYIIDETEFIMFYTLTDSITNEQSYHIGYADGGK